jgi:uncharacterized protein (DUF169 family)
MTTVRRSLDELLGPVAEPVTITFRDTAPRDMERVAAPAPAGCSYWKLAADGDAFYTLEQDHLNCPIGAYTHGVELTPKIEAELQGMIGKMGALQYLKEEEVPGIPRRRQALRAVVYAPLSKTEGTPDIVLLRGNARQMMLLAEAATARQLMSSSPILGRPACAVVAATAESGKVTASLGCIGNRVYTGLADDEMYIAVPGSALDQTIDALRTIVAANAELEKFHRERAGEDGKRGLGIGD